MEDLGIDHLLASGAARRERTLLQKALLWYPLQATRRLHHKNTTTFPISPVAGTDHHPSPVPHYLRLFNELFHSDSLQSLVLTWWTFLNVIPVIFGLPFRYYLACLSLSLVGLLPAPLNCALLLDYWYWIAACTFLNDICLPKSQVCLCSPLCLPYDTAWSVSWPLLVWLSLQ